MSTNREVSGRANRPRAVVLIIATAVLGAVVLSACGGSSSSTGSNGTGVQKLSNSKKMAEEGAKSAKTPAVKLEPQTVGIVSIVESAENVHRATVGAEEAAAALGWKTMVCDAEGLPNKEVTCAQSMIDKGATLILGNVIAPTVVRHQLQEAKEKGIPWINFLGFVEESPYLLAQVVENEREHSEVASDFIVSQNPPVKTVAYDEYPPVAAVTERIEVFKEIMAEHNVELVSSYVSDETDFGKAANWAEGVLAKEPELGAFNFNNEEAVPVANVLAANPKYRGKKYPERPLMVTIDATKENMNGMRKGYIDGITEVPDGAAGWEAIDVAAQYFAHGTKPAPEPNPPGNYGYPVDFMKPFLVTPKNLPTNPNEYPAAPNDYKSFFQARWQKEFNK